MCAFTCTHTDFCETFHCYFGLEAGKEGEGSVSITVLGTGILTCDGLSQISTLKTKIHMQETA